MSSRQERPGRARVSVGPEAGMGIAVGAAIGGLAGLAWALFRKKKTFEGEENSPVIIKSGSLSVYVKDGKNRDVVGKKDKQYQVTRDDITTMTQWDVSLVELVGGFPLADSNDLTEVKSVALEVVKEDGDPLDTITIVVETDSATKKQVLVVRATDDNNFASNTHKRKNKKSKQHEMRAITKEIKGEENFVIASVTVDYTGGPKTFSAGDDYALACTFK